MSATIAASTDLIDAAKALAPLIESYREESERERTLPTALVSALAQADLLRMCVPKSRGGLEADPITSLRVIEELARADGAVAWNVMNWAAGALCGARLDESAARGIYGGDPSVVITASLAPKGRAEVVEGGYRLSGRWTGERLCACVLARGRRRHHRGGPAAFPPERSTGRADDVCATGGMRHHRHLVFHRTPRHREQ